MEKIITERKGIIIQFERNFGHIGLIFFMIKYVYALPCHFAVAE